MSNNEHSHARQGFSPVRTSAFTGEPTYEIEGHYFTPDETVAVAVLLRTTEADIHSGAKASVRASELPGRWEALLLIGYDSGTLCYDDPRR